MPLAKEWNRSDQCAASLVSLLGEACARIEPVGDIRMRRPEATEVALVLIPKVEVTPELLGEQMGENRLAEKLKMLQKIGILTPEAGGAYRFAFDGHRYRVRLIETTEEAWIAQRFQSSCSREVFITVATAAKCLGLKWAPKAGGFLDIRTGRLTRVASEEEIYATVKLPYAPVEDRFHIPEFEHTKSGREIPMTVEEVRAWVGEQSWVDTWNGGDYHQYTFRTSRDELEFLRVAEMIRAYGYDGKHKRKVYRYLDLDGFCIFDNGNNFETSSVLNKKRLRQPPTPWALNPIPWPRKPDRPWYKRREETP